MVSFSVLFSLQRYGIISKQRHFTYGKRARGTLFITTINQPIAIFSTIYLMETSGKAYKLSPSLLTNRVEKAKARPTISAPPLTIEVPVTGRFPFQPVTQPVTHDALRARTDVVRSDADVVRYDIDVVRYRQFALRCRHIIGTKKLRVEKQTAQQTPLSYRNGRFSTRRIMGTAL